MSSNMIGGDYTTALEVNADNSWAGDVSARSARTQVMNPESLGTYQRPLQVFKYMHIHEFMKGRSQYGNPAGTLGATPQARDGKRALHLTTKMQEEEEESRQKKEGDQGRGGKSRSRSKLKENAGQVEEEEAGAPAESAGWHLPLEQDFLNKGYYVWEAVRREWRGTPEQVAAARARSAANRREPLDTDDMENQLEDSDVETFSRPISLPDLVEVLDELWQGERTL
mmetsp:Transcript_30836/g.62503  ORF Transcript_30836/g.62503 Transcript_30836/m.62503 type:complete len:226 (+) Transcript_30836:271-948(+)